MTKNTPEQSGAAVIGFNTAAAALELPPALHDWALQNQPLMMHLRRAITESTRPLSEEALWEMVAGGVSTEWTTARMRMDTAARELRHQTDPENIPLGLIGQGLDGGELDAAESAHLAALAEFTIVNEMLYQQPELRSLLKTLVDIQPKLERSERATRAALKTTESLDRLLGQQPQKSGFQLRSIGTHFKSLAARAGLPGSRARKKTAGRQKPSASTP